MKKIIGFLLTAVTFYLACMYHFLPFLILCGMEILMAVVCFLMSRYFRRHVSVTFAAKKDAGVAEGENVCTLNAVNTGRLPVSRYRLKLEAGYWSENMKAVDRLESAADRGENQIQFGVLAPCCGLLKLRLERIRLYDYFSLFHADKKLKEMMEIAVFPREQSLQISFSGQEGAKEGGQEEQTLGRRGDAYYELYQIREYRNGDLNRHIHWNLSARTDELWVKEYAQETDAVMPLFLDTEDLYGADREEKSDFYTLFMALAAGLLKNMAALEIRWYDREKGRFEQAAAADMEQCRGVLYRLYQMNTQDVFEGEEAAEHNLYRNSFLMLDAGLGLYWRGALVFRFSSENLDQEIRERALII